MTFIWATRGRTWGFRFLLDAGLEDPRTEYLRRFASVENAMSAYGRDGDVVVARFPILWAGATPPDASSLTNS